MAHDVKPGSAPEESPVPEFAFDCDPGDESSPSCAVEATARSGTISSSTPFPAGF
ncbi:MAG: hypothetical protein JO041_03700 [Acidobacteria bacterium]|nr:hypothetical protein [Acidobacteriota bacterium]